MKILTAIIVCLLTAIPAEAKIPPLFLGYPGFALEEYLPPTPQRVIEGLEFRIESDPFNYALYSILGYFYEEVGDKERMLKSWRMAIKYLPHGVEEKEFYLGNFVRALMLNNRAQESKQWLDKAEAINPNYIINRWNHFLYYFELKKDFRAAAAELPKIQALYQDDKKSAYFDAYPSPREEEEQRQEWIRLFEAAIDLAPQEARAYHALGTVICDVSEERLEANLPLALKNFKKALVLNPEYIPTYISMADSFVLLADQRNKHQNYQKALKWLQKAYEVDPNHLLLAYRTGNVYFFMEQYQQAIDKYEFAYKGGLENERLPFVLALAYNNRAYDLYKSGEDLDLGLALVDKALTLMPDDGILWSTKAELLYKKGEYKMAYRLIKKALALNPDEEELKQDLLNIEQALKEE